jgi:guanylate kinase
MRDAPSLHRHVKTIASRAKKDGTILSFTIIRNPPKGFGHERYVVGLIEHADGSHTCAQIIDEGLEPAIGARVVPCLRRIRALDNGLIVNDFKYEVVDYAREPVTHVQRYVLALTGPSGVGKTTVTHMLLHLFSSYAEQVPIYTTRKPKKNDMEPYRHVTKEQFADLQKKGEIIAATRMDSTSEDRQYGYVRSDIEALWAKGKLPIVVTDLHLLKGLSESLGRRAILSCGLLPPGTSRRRMLSVLLHRLRGRGRDTEEQIQERLKVAEIDLAAFDLHPHLFDHLFVNESLDTCVESIRSIVKK